MKIITTKHYFRTLLAALSGRDPYRLKLEQVRSELDKAYVDFGELRNLYYICKEKSEKTSQQIGSLQNLVELLRERIREKDDQIEQMRSAYQMQAESYEKRIGDYSLAINRLQDELGGKEQCHD